MHKLDPKIDSAIENLWGPAQDKLKEVEDEESEDEKEESEDEEEDKAKFHLPFEAINSKLTHVKKLIHQEPMIYNRI